jgi:hypothetical protein
MVSDPIADMLTRIRNGIMTRQKQVVVRFQDQGCAGAHPEGRRLHPGFRSDQRRAAVAAAYCAEI